MQTATCTNRVSWDDYFSGLALAASTRATCPHRRDGAVIVHERRIVATGYTGGPSGYPHCDEAGCPDDGGGGQCPSIDADANAILFSAPADREGATLYCTSAPTFASAKLIANSGISEVVAASGRYDGWARVREFLLSSGVRVRVLDTLA